ncbi:MAG: hypothetical protein WC546_01730 [Candidatus Omnitrophota bacterium]|jgi:hypothetical protein
MGVYVYCIKEDYRYPSLIKERVFENEWLRLERNGVVTIKGSNHKGYAWDGCSPKLKIKDIYVGTFEGVLNLDTGQSKTFYASLIHDVFYQFSKEVKPFIKRREVDREFYIILKNNGFRFAKFYYIAVRLFGWMFWYK